MVVEDRYLGLQIARGRALNATVGQNCERLTNSPMSFADKGRRPIRVRNGTEFLFAFLHGDCKGVLPIETKFYRYSNIMRKH